MAIELLGLPWWAYLLAVLAALLLGAFLSAIGFFIYARYESWKLKKGTPFETPFFNIWKWRKKVDRKEVSEFLNKPEVRAEMNYPGLPVKYSEQEVQEDDKQRTVKFREFEKLRRAVESGATPSYPSAPAGKPSDEGAGGVPERAEVPQGADSEAAGPKRGRPRKLTLD